MRKAFSTKVIFNKREHYNVLISECCQNNNEYAVNTRKRTYDRAAGQMSE